MSFIFLLTRQKEGFGLYFSLGKIGTDFFYFSVIFADTVSGIYININIYINKYIECTTGKSNPWAVKNYWSCCWCERYVNSVNQLWFAKKNLKNLFT